VAYLKSKIFFLPFSHISINSILRLTKENKDLKMKTLIATIITSLMLATAAQATPFNLDPTTIQEKAYGLGGSGYVKSDIQEPVMQLAYYGQINSNGTIRTNRVSGYTKSNGTYVAPYYRS